MLKSITPWRSTRPVIHTLGVDDLLTLISNERRRETITYLADRNSPVKRKELCDTIAWIEHPEVERIEDLTQTEKKSVYVVLYQNHLPKLEEAGVIEQDRDTIIPTEVTQRVARVITEIRQMTNGTEEQG